MSNSLKCLQNRLGSICAVTKHIPKLPSPATLKAEAAAEPEEQLEGMGICQRASALAARTLSTPSAPTIPTAGAHSSPTPVLQP